MSKALLVAALTGGLGFGIGMALGRMNEAPAAVETAAEPIRDPPGAAGNGWRRGGSELVRPLLGCLGGSGFEALRQPILDVITAARARGQLGRVGVYLHDLTDGQTLSIDADTLFVPASMGKVPLLMGLLRVEEDRPGTLESPVFYPDWMRDNDHQGIRPASTVAPGRSWTLGQLAEAMIVESNNNATTLVRRALDTALVSRVYVDLGWQAQAMASGEVTLAATSARIVGDMFRVLYNATYLGEGSSDRALRLLTRVTMREGLVAGVPPDVTVAHKFGEWLIGTPDETSVGQFHDCGIIYRPGRPYVLCVMTEGQTTYQRPLIDVVAEISRVSWNAFEASAP